MSDKKNKMQYTAKNPAVIAAVEAGGTSFVVAICHHKSTASSGSTTLHLPTIVHRLQVDSSHNNPQTTLSECAAFLQKHKPNGGYHALGIASFGPLGVTAGSSDYGTILASSPKAQWRKMDLLTPLRAACQGDARPLWIKVDTDVNAPAMAEFELANTPQQPQEHISSLAYVTVGTGIGVGLVVNDQPVHGHMHPEGGHIPVRPLPGDSFGKDGYSWGSQAPFEGRNTVEGLASSVALTERYEQWLQQNNKKDSAIKKLSRDILKDVPQDHELWDHAGNALANLCATLLLTLSIERIVLGGGLMQCEGLLAKVQERTKTLLNGYLTLPSLDTVIVTSQFGKDAGLMGTIVLAQAALLSEGRDDNSKDTATNSKKTKAEEITMKQVAFGTGLWHGAIVGALGTALLCKYWFLPKHRTVTSVV